MRQRLLLACMAIFAIMSLHAQVVTWAVRPGTYTKIEPCWRDLFLVYEGNSVGVINGNGREIVPPSATRITGFYGSLALVLKSFGGQERILGILSTEGTYTEIEDKYFTIPNQEFFSEGYLTVMTSQGNAGFMDTNGRVKEFPVTFVSPFSEGYAVVGEGGNSHNFSIIDKNFNTLQISITSMSPLWNGANVYNGTAIVWDGNGTLFEFNPKKGATCTVVKDKTIKKILKDCDYNPDYDYLGGIKEMTGRSEKVTYNQPEHAALTLAATKQGGKYGYAKDGKVILPYQFEQAGNFYGNYAVIQSDGKYALLELHNSNDLFDAKASSDIRYKKGTGKGIAHRFGLSVPNYWSEGDIRVKVKDANGIALELTNSGNTYEFKADGGQNKDTRNYNVEVHDEGMLLWQGEIAYQYIVEVEPPIIITPPPGYKPLTVSLKPANTQADKNNRCYVTATIRNPNSEPITTTVSMTGSNLLEAVSQRVTIPAYGEKDVSTYFKLAKTVHKGYVTVSTSAGGSDKLEGLQLIPF